MVKLRQKTVILSLGVCGFSPYSLGLPFLASEIRLGIISNQGSSTGFEKVLSSSLMLDIYRTFGRQVSFGFRSLTQHGGSFYSFSRVSSGPSVGYRFDSQWNIHGHVGIFRESAKIQSAQLYNSKGNSLSMGVERVYAHSKSLEIKFGGYYELYSGVLSYINADGLPYLGPHSSMNRGTYKGLAMGLKFALD